MTKRMLIDTTHAEETRVVVLDGNRLEDYDVETSAKKQLKGNIYLAKVVRVEPSLQAAFVEYGGNRHGFLAFSEIHPDYYQIPVADRERLIALQEEEARAEEAREDAREVREQEESRRREVSPSAPSGGDGARTEDSADHDRQVDEGDSGSSEPLEIRHDERRYEMRETGRPYADEPDPDQSYSDQPYPDGSFTGSAADDATETGNSDENGGYENNGAEPAPETVGGESDTSDETRPAPQSTRFLRQYKIQEVIRRRQILLIQVVKEERGSKGAALTTYISLAGRFCVLMPNSLRGGGVSRKITSAADRKRLKEITTELEIPRGMAMIVRTAGAQRPRPEIRRDCEYLLRLWDDIREQTLRAMAPALIYEEANLIKRAIRDVYTRDIEEIVVDGGTGWKAAREFMRNLMPANAQKVVLWRDHGQPLFSYYQVEHYLDAMLQPTVQLRSGGYLVINQTEALVAIDVNSGRSTRERGIEETALRTNLEAADEVARQLRLRDLAGLIVIDFIDMEARKHNAMVERRLKEALKNDRARIQVGQISHFGLMEMSRQRLRPSIAESSFITCAHCGGTGFIRGTDSAALHVLRAIEEEGGKQRAAEILVHVAASVALYILNHKRVWLAEIEQRHRMTVNFNVDDALIPPQLRIETKRAQVAAPVLASEAFAGEPPANGAHGAAGRRPPASGVVTHGHAEPAVIEEIPYEAGAGQEDTDDEFDGPEGASPQLTQDNAPVSGANPAAESSEEERKRKRRRRRRRGRREESNGAAAEAVMPQDTEQPDIDDRGLFGQDTAFEAAASDLEQTAPQEPVAFVDEDPDGELGLQNPGEIPLSEEQGVAPRRRGRRGGARGRRSPDGAAAPGEPQPAQVGKRAAAYSGPTPANPFGATYDIFDIIEQDADLAQELAIELPLPADETPAPGALLEPVPQAAEPEPEAVAEIPSGTADAAPAELSSEPPGTEAAAKPKRKRATTPRAKAEPKPPKAAATPKPRLTKARKAELAAAAAAAAAETEAPLPEAAPAEPEAAAPPEPADAAQRTRTVVQPVLIDEIGEPPARRTGWWKR